MLEPLLSESATTSLYARVAAAMKSPADTPNDIVVGRSYVITVKLIAMVYWHSMLTWQVSS